ncbi:MAG: flagellin, partial [Bacillota bacterium]|nr:flagellin [Bacillota bacterium]
MRINNNLMAMNTLRQLTINDSNTAKSVEKLSSGYRINRAGDDAAGLAISEKMRAQISGLNMASKNSQDGISMVQTAEGALTETHSILQRMRELAVQSSSDTNDDDVDRDALQSEFQQLTSEIDDISSKTTFNKKNLLDGTLGKNALGTNSNAVSTTDDIIAARALADNINISAGDMATGTYTLTSYQAADSTHAESFTLHSTGKDYTVSTGTNNVKFAADTSYDVMDGSTKVGTISFKDDALAAGTGIDTNSANVQFAVTGSSAAFQTGANEGDEMEINIGNMSSSALGIDSIVSVATRDEAKSAITTIDSAINKVSTQRANLGAVQNRLEHKINNLDTSAENLQSAESRIRDVDMAKEM